MRILKILFGVIKFLRFYFMACLQDWRRRIRISSLFWLLIEFECGFVKDSLKEHGIIHSADPVYNDRFISKNSKKLKVNPTKEKPHRQEVPGSSW